MEGVDGTFGWVGRKATADTQDRKALVHRSIVACCPLDRFLVHIVEELQECNPMEAIDEQPEDNLQSFVEAAG